MPEPFVRPDVRALLAMLAAAGARPLHEMTAPEARAVGRAARGLVEVEAEPLAIVRDAALTAPDGHAVAVRLFDARADRAPGPVMVFFHGGGFVLGDLDGYAPLCATIATALDLPVVSVDYRLAPEHRWPAAPDDCEAAARWVASAPAALGLEPTALVLAGDSAGGALAIITALALRDAPAAVPVIAQWPIYPTVDAAPAYESFRRFKRDYMLTAEIMGWFSDAYRADLSHWRGSPILADQAGLPPTLVVTAGLDPLLDQGRAYAAACIKAGVPTVYREAVGTIHGCFTLRRALPSAEADLQACLAVLKSMIAEVEASVMARAA